MEQNTERVVEEELGISERDMKRIIISAGTACSILLGGFFVKLIKETVSPSAPTKEHYIQKINRSLEKNYISAKEFDDYRAFLEGEIAEKKNEEEMTLLLGEVLQIKDHYEEALSNYEKLLEIPELSIRYTAKSAIQEVLKEVGLRALQKNTLEKSTSLDMTAFDNFCNKYPTDFSNCKLVKNN